VRELYADHVATLRERAERALAETGFDTLVLTSGTPQRYFADDMDAPHHETPHFAHWVPARGPHHVLAVEPGRRPRLFFVSPEDYWYEQVPLGAPYWVSELDVEEVGSEARAFERLGSIKGAAYVGDAPDAARALGFADEAINPGALVARLDWERAVKTPYEVACLEEAEVVAARGHVAARAAFEDGASELEIHRAYVAATGVVDKELPYESIVALDEKGATLHYTGKRTKRDGRVLLIDAGVRYQGYCSDITRTWTRGSADPLFVELLQGVDRLQRELCDLVRPKIRYPELHAAAHAKIADLLHALGVLALGGTEAVALGLTRPFLPHGLGHFLGIQVHDVGGHQKDRTGGTQPPPPEHPFLRTTRELEPGQVFTIEPGVYFIELLLGPERAGKNAAHYDWKLIERLKPFGGIRIEDNVLVTADGHRNLTRPHLE
jgi:Xaa-Pro dipeptidase